MYSWSTFIKYDLPSYKGEKEYTYSGFIYDTEEQATAAAKTEAIRIANAYPALNDAIRWQVIGETGAAVEGGEVVPDGAGGNPPPDPYDFTPIIVIGFLVLFAAGMYFAYTSGAFKHLVAGET